MFSRLKLEPREEKGQRRPFRGREKQAFAPDTATAAVPGVSSVPGIGRNRKILVVDDNPAVVKAFELKLKASGFAVVTAGDASSVSGIVASEHPELIVLDVNFPNSGGLEWNGLSIMQWLRRLMDGPGVPIIFITGEDSPKLKDRLLESGAVGFFQKPVVYDEFLATILRILG